MAVPAYIVTFEGAFLCEGFEPNALGEVRRFSPQPDFFF